MMSVGFADLDVEYTARPKVYVKAKTDKSKGAGCRKEVDISWISNVEWPRTATKKSASRYERK